MGKGWPLAPHCGRSAPQKGPLGFAICSLPIEKMSDDYLQHNASIEDAAKDMINKQVIKCTTSGFITNLDGVITLPVTIPANVGSVMYVQMRMIACAVYMAGYDVHTDQVQTLVYACLAGVSVMEVAKKAGIKIGQKGLENLIDKIPGKVLIAINQKVGFRMLTKFGETGAINIGKAIPVVGGVIGGGFDFIDTKFIGNRAYNQLILSQPMRLYNSLYETSFLVDSYIFVPGWPVSARYSAENPSFRH